MSINDFPTQHKLFFRVTGMIKGIVGAIWIISPRSVKVMLTPQTEFTPGLETLIRICGGTLVSISALMLTIPYITKPLSQSYGLSCTVMTGLLLHLMTQKPAVVNPYFIPWLVTTSFSALYFLFVPPPVRTLDNVTTAIATERGKNALYQG